MEWIKLNKEKLPELEVLAANFKFQTFGYKEKCIGYLYLNNNGEIICENNHELLGGCTHYIPINDFDL